VRRRPPPTIDDMRVVNGFAAPGASATTIGRTVFVRRGLTMSPRLRRHEYEHVLQFHELGRIRFLVRYLREYLRWRVRRHRHDGSYRRISFEIRAEWRARRELGIGVIDGAATRERERTGRPARQPSTSDSSTSGPHAAH
jgi:hypothetical protein